MRYGVMGSILAAAAAAAALVAAQAGSGAAAPAKWIVFSAHPNGDSAAPAQLFRVPSTGGTPEQITSGRLTATQPAFSPDGKTIAFQRLGSGLFRMNLDGSGLKRLTSRPRDAYPVYSNDGKRIAFIRLH